MLKRVLADVASWPVDRSVVVLGPDAEEILAGMDLDECVFVVDEEWTEGGAAPLRAGLDVLARDPGVEAAVIVPGDLPGIPPDVVAALIDRWRETPRRAVAPVYRYAVGWPVVAGRELFGRLLGLEGDVDLLGNLARHEGIETVHVDRLAPRRVTAASELPTRRR